MRASFECAGLKFIPENEGGVGIQFRERKNGANIQGASRVR